jgi:hypothetical protein
VVVKVRDCGLRGFQSLGSKSGCQLIDGVGLERLYNGKFTAYDLGD